MSETDESFNAADPVKVRRRRKDSAAKQQRIDAVLAALMEQKQGREFVWSLLERCRIYQLSYADNPQRMAFYDGHRNVGLQLVADLMRVASEEYVIMSKEQAVE